MVQLGDKDKEEQTTDQMFDLVQLDGEDEEEIGAGSLNKEMHDKLDNLEVALGDVEKKILKQEKNEKVEERRERDVVPGNAVGRRVSKRKAVENAEGGMEVKRRRNPGEEGDMPRDADVEEIRIIGDDKAGPKDTEFQRRRRETVGKVTSESSRIVSNQVTGVFETEEVGKKQRKEDAKIDDDDDDNGDVEMIEIASNSTFVPFVP